MLLTCYLAVMVEPSGQGSLEVRLYGVKYLLWTLQKFVRARLPNETSDGAMQISAPRKSALAISVMYTMPGLVPKAVTDKLCLVRFKVIKKTHKERDGISATYLRGLRSLK